MAAALVLGAGCDKKKTEPAAAGSGSAVVTTGSGSGSGSAAAMPATGSGSGSGSAGSGAGSGSSAAVDPDPWDAKPQDVVTKVGNKSGGDLAQIDPWDKAPDDKPPADLQEKVDVAKIEKPVEDKVDKIDIPTIDAKETGGFKVIYNDGKKDSHNKFKALFEKDRIFEQVAEGLNKTVRLPVAVPINTVSCNTINAFYDPRGKRIIVCYELFEYFLGLFKGTAKTEAELGNAVLGATMFGFFHEVGHGLIDVLDLASTGPEEDAADELATLTLIGAGDEGVHMAVSGAYWFKLQAKSGHTTPFWDEHSFDEKRFYNIICLIYGSDPRKYSGFITSGNLPVQRAQRCPDEYVKKKKAWEKLLGPHLTNGAALNVGYKPNIPVAEAPKQTNTDPWDDDGTAGAPQLPPPTPSTGSAAPVTTCEAVADHAIALIKTQAELQGQTMSPKERADLQAKLDTELPSARENIIAQCAKEKWSDAARKCVMDSKSFAQLSKCK